MKKKTLLWLIPACIFTLAIGFLSYRYVSLPKIPKEDPTEIVALYATADGTISYTITEQSDIHKIMEQFHSIKIHRTIDITPDLFRKTGGLFIFHEIQFLYPKQTFLYTHHYSDQFYLHYQNNKGAHWLYEMSAKDYEDLQTLMKETCGISTAPPAD